MQARTAMVAMPDERLYDGPFLRVCRRDGWEYVERTNARGAVIVVAQTAADEVILVEQPRVPVDARVIEFPAGLVGDRVGDENEELAAAAARELEEETGYGAGALALVTGGPPSAGLASEITWWFRASELVAVGAGGGDASEEIVVHRIPRAEVDAWLSERRDAGVLVDPKVFAGLYFLDRAPR